jgi:uncharacterized hydrophobic protein (TIGR00271 family)
MAATTTAPAPRLVDARMSLGAASLDDLFPEGPAFRHSLITYTVLLTMAALVATFGLFQDSVASIIGAMVMAPLGGAILATAGALVTGRSRWLVIALIQVALSTAWVIAIGFAVSIVMPDLLELTPSLEARTEPGILDLGVALAAGAAGAFVAVRKTGSDALPGVAIAVALVPPLSTVGICLELGRLDDAAGAMLLFSTNLAAILVIASLVFILAGSIPTVEDAGSRQRRRRGLIIAIVSLSLITVPLLWRSVGNVVSAISARNSNPVVVEWIGDRDLTVLDFQVSGESITLDIAGSVVPRDVPVLADSLADALGHPIDLKVEYTPRIEVQASGGG